MVSGDDDDDDYNYTYYDGSDGLSVEEEVADVLWTVNFSDNTLTIRDAELGASKLAEAGLLADDTRPRTTQWGVAQENEHGEWNVVAAPSRSTAEHKAGQENGFVVEREVSEWRKIN